MDDISINARMHIDCKINNEEGQTHTVQVSIKLPKEEKELLFEDISGASEKIVTG